MYISKLQLHGFKSFSSRETLEFGHGITSIVGPNGCGKTNIVDAIRWVLGEQKYSVLRSARMEDIIFSGAKGIKPLGVSEVYLTVHNNRGKLPVEYTDVEIGRRIYRNGESEYFINRSSCRLKDVQNLFIDTGMGSDAYSVIELKMIEQILSETSDDRKRMFEEAAGINKYKHQKQSAIRKFDATRHDLERVDDIIHEVETKVHGLQLQLKRFKRHEKLSSQLKEKEHILATRRILSLGSRSEPLEGKIREIQNQRQSMTDAENRRETELSQVREAYRQSEKELEEMQTGLQDLETRREAFQHEILRWSEQVKSAGENTRRLKDEDATLVIRKEQVGSQVEEYHRELDDLEPVIEEKLNTYREKQTELDRVNGDTLGIEKIVDEIQSRRWEAQQSLADHRSLVERTRSYLHEKEALINKLDLRIKDLEKDNSGLATEQKDLKERKEVLSEQIADCTGKIEEISGTLEGEKQHQQQVSVEILKIRSKIETATSQLAFFRELVATYEGYPGGVQYALENRDRLKGLAGTVGDLFTVESKYEKAIESSLGTWAGCLVVDTRKNALKILEEINRSQSGDVSILPLSETADIRTRKVPAPDHPDVIGRASDFINCGNEMRSILEILLANVFIVEKLDLNADTHPETTLVDLDGSLIGSNYLIKNFYGKSERSLIGRQKKIADLEKEIIAFETSMKDLENDDRSSREQIRESTRKKADYDLKLNVLREQLTEIDTGIIKNHYSQSQTLETINDLRSEQVSAEKDLTQLTESLERLIPEEKEKAGLLQKTTDTLTEKEALLTEARKTLDDFSRMVQEVRIDLLNIENQKDGLVFQIKTAEESLHELEKRREQIAIEAKGLEKKVIELETSIKEAQTSLGKVKGKVNSQKSILELKKQALNALFEEMESLESSIRNEQKSREMLIENMKRYETELSEIEQEKNLIRQRIHDLYGLEVPGDYSAGELSQDEADLEMTIDRIRKGLERIGPVNMAVQDEYEEEDRRLKHLVEQKTDLLESEKNLRESIQKIDRVARKQFKDTFDKIKLNFEKLFTMFFEGGQGTISLIGDPDPLEAEIAIAAQPPGKRNATLRAMSAGEKALTAISLLFAIYQVKPSPYCILDEVDAPLDDTNVRKFTRVLKEFARDTQFIIVTHNKLTMEAADYLYGVTMEKKGISKLVSVKFKGEKVSV